MKILFRYINLQVAAMILLVALALVGLDYFVTLVHELKIVGKADYTLSLALIYLGLQTPSRFYEMFPWAALLGTMISLGMLAQHRELVVMRTSRVSVQKIAGMLVLGTSMLLAIVVFIGEGIAPLCDKLAQNLKTQALSKGTALYTPYGMWVRQGNTFIHVQNVSSADTLQNVTQYEFDGEQHLKTVTVAERAKRNKNNTWTLTHIYGTSFGKDKTSLIQQEQSTIPDLLEPEILELEMVKHLDRLSLWTLYRAIRHQSRNELDSSLYQLAFWAKIFQPVTILLMVFLAVSFVMGPLRSTSQGLRILAGILFVFVFHTIGKLFAPLAVVYQWSAILAVITPLVFFGAVGFYLLRRVN